MRYSGGLHLGTETMNPYYAADLTAYLKIMDELQHSLMMPARRAVLETCKEAMEVVLEMYCPKNMR